MSAIAERLNLVRDRIRNACLASGRPPDAVQLIAVSKTFNAAELREAIAAGQRDFGESYLQEALPKQASLAGLGLVWHFIGPLQSNKTRDIALHFDWVHGVDRLRIAERLSAQRPQSLGPLNVCIQVNISGEASKSGCTLAELPTLCAAVHGLPQLRLRGLMAIPAPAAAADARAPYRTLARLFEDLRQHGNVDAADFDTLSTGMSDDLEAAIAEGSTMVRVGSAIFGERPVPGAGEAPRFL